MAPGYFGLLGYDACSTYRAIDKAEGLMVFDKTTTPRLAVAAMACAAVAFRLLGHVPLAAAQNKRETPVPLSPVRLCLFSRAPVPLSLVHLILSLPCARAFFSTICCESRGWE